MNIPFFNYFAHHLKASPFIFFFFKELNFIKQSNCLTFLQIKCVLFSHSVEYLEKQEDRSGEMSDGNLYYPSNSILFKFKVL